MLIIFILYVSTLLNLSLNYIQSLVWTLIWPLGVVVLVRLGYLPTALNAALAWKIVVDIQSGLSSRAGCVWTSVGARRLLFPAVVVAGCFHKTLFVVGLDLTVAVWTVSSQVFGVDLFVGGQAAELLWAHLSRLCLSTVVDDLLVLLGDVGIVVWHVDLLVNSLMCVEESWRIGSSQDEDSVFQILFFQILKLLVHDQGLREVFEFFFAFVFYFCIYFEKHLQVSGHHVGQRVSIRLNFFQFIVNFLNLLLSFFFSFRLRLHVQFFQQDFYFSHTSFSVLLDIASLLQQWKEISPNEIGFHRLQSQDLSSNSLIIDEFKRAYPTQTLEQLIIQRNHDCLLVFKASLSFVCVSAAIVKIIILRALTQKYSPMRIGRPRPWCSDWRRALILGDAETSISLSGAIIIIVFLTAGLPFFIVCNIS